MVKNGFRPHANASHFPEKAKNYMMILENKTDLVTHLDQLRSLPSWNPLAKSVAYYQVKPNEDSKDAAIKIINEFREFKILKSIVLIYYSLNDDITSYSWSPYSDENCANKCESVYILDICKDNNIKQFQPQREMFPSDLKGCPLITYAVISEPYVMPPERKVTNTIWSDAYEFQKGGEINLVKIISQFTNMSLIIRVSDKEENWGVIYPDGRATGAYSMLRNDSVDLVIGNIEVTRTIRKWFHPTVSYTQDEMTWCVPKAKPAATWDNLIIIFQWSTWVATTVSVSIMGSVFHFMYYKERDEKITKWPTNSILMTFSMLLGWGARFEPKSSAFRILIFVWLCFSLNMAISYESFLRSFLIHPRFEKQISTESDLIQSGIPLGGRDLYKSYFENNNASDFYLYRKYNSTAFSEGIRRVAIESFAVVSSRRQAEYMDQKLGKGAPLIYCFPESNNLYKYGVVLLTRKWFPMLERFNNIIRSVSENGLIDKWNEELFLHSTREITSAILPLSIQHLLGAFILIGILYAVSVGIFIGEITFGMLKRRKIAETFKIKLLKILLAMFWY
ncbi:uncharacterized protein LOC120632146 [Pararge aegeria]|uniref:uncharacterized protein LOC120632146 n=1 Tax=Pararge aegeria TaxID=116150 RepID=UPI0019D0B308|nr:uncharacterized protein LOC120632146 [Pararge aegeria]